MTTTDTLRRGALGVLAVFLAGCGTSITTNFDDVSFEVIEEAQFAATLEIDLADFTRLESGIWIHDEVEGTGEALANGNSPDLTYAGWLSDGQQFDAGSYTFLMGANQVIPGFEVGMLGMKPGGVRRMIIPPEWAYGARGSGPIPGGAIVIFRVELIDFS